MKILFLSHNFYPFIGGIEVISEMLCSSFAQAGHEVCLLTWADDGDDTSFAFEIIRKPSTYVLLRRHAWADLVFENNPGLRLSWPAIFFNRPLVIAIHTWISRTDGRIAIQDRLKRIWLKRAHTVIAVSEAIRKSCFLPAIVIGNPYRADTFKILDHVKRTVDFLFLGRLVNDKGPDMAIKALHQFNNSLAEGSTRSSLTIIGDGPMRQQLEDLTASLNMQDQVSFTGALQGKELVFQLNSHRFLLIPSIWKEPFGIVALEGIACGCLPVVADEGGLPDAVGKAGLTFKRGDLNALVSCMKWINENPEAEDELRQAAKKQLKNFHPQHIIKKYLQVINAAMTLKLQT